MCIFILAFLSLICLLWLSGYRIDEVKTCRSFWGSLLNAYTQSVLILTCHKIIITKCTVLKKDDPCCGNSQWNGLPMGFEFTVAMPVHMPLGFVTFV